MLNPHRAMDWVLLFVRTVSVVFSEDIHFDAFLTNNKTQSIARCGFNILSGDYFISVIIPTKVYPQNLYLFDVLRNKTDRYSFNNALPWFSRRLAKRIVQCLARVFPKVWQRYRLTFEKGLFKV